MTTYPAYRHGLTIEKREGVWCVTNDFGGPVLHTCDGLEDALDIRERTAFGYPQEAIDVVARLDVTRNATHALKLTIAEIAGEEPRRIYDTRRRGQARYAAGDVWGYEGEDHIEALQSLLHCVRIAKFSDAVDRALASLDSVREGSDYQMEAAAE